MSRDADEIDLRCPEIVARNAAHALELRAKFGRGGTEIGVARARDLKNRVNLSPNTIKRMVSFFARHEVDKRAKNFGNEASIGHIYTLAALEVTADQPKKTVAARSVRAPSPAAPSKPPGVPKGKAKAKPAKAEPTAKQAKPKPKGKKR